MQDDAVVVGVLVVVGVPVGRLQVQLDVAGYGCGPLGGDDRVVEVRPRSVVGSAGVHHPKPRAVLGDQVLREGIGPTPQVDEGALRGSPASLSRPDSG